MNVYLTARWGRREEMRIRRNMLELRGHRVTSRWLDEGDDTAPGVGAQIDLDDIDAADALIAFTEPPEVGYTTGGRHVELGYAIAKKKPVLIVGPRENVFCHLEGASATDGNAGIMAWLDGLLDIATRCGGPG